MPESAASSMLPLTADVLARVPQSTEQTSHYVIQQAQLSTQQTAVASAKATPKVSDKLLRRSTDEGDRAQRAQELALESNETATKLRHRSEYSEDHVRRLEERRRRRRDKAAIVSDKSIPVVKRVQKQAKEVFGSNEDADHPRLAGPSHPARRSKSDRQRSQLLPLPQSVRSKSLGSASHRLTVPNPKLGIFNNGLASAKTSTASKSAKRRSRALKDIAFNEQHFFKKSEENRETDDEMPHDAIKRTQMSSDTCSSQDAGMIMNTSKFFAERDAASRAGRVPSEGDSDEMHSAYSLEMRQAANETRAKRSDSPPLSYHDHVKGPRDLDRRDHRKGSTSHPPRDAGKRREDPAPEYFRGYFDQDGPFRPVNAWRSEEARKSKMELERKDTAPTSPMQATSPPASPIRLHRTEQDTSRSSPLRRFLTMVDLDRILGAPSSDGLAPPPANAAHDLHSPAEHTSHDLTDQMTVCEPIDEESMRNFATVEEEESMEYDNEARMQDLVDLSAALNPTVRSIIESPALEGFWRPFRP